MEPIRLRERGDKGTECALDAEHASALEATELVHVRPAGPGKYRLVPRGRVGAVRIGDLDVQVLPKVSIDRLLFMLGYARNPGFLPDEVSGAAEPDLWPAIAESLARLTERALAGGIMQGYISQDDSMPLVRGRIRVGDQIARRPGSWFPLEVRYDDYAVDIAENRILRSAIRRMASVSRVSGTHNRRLSHLDAQLDGVRLLAADEPLPHWNPTRLNARYPPALRLAEVILQNQSAEPGPAGLDIAAFVVNMETVFEDFVCVALREAFLLQSLGETQIIGSNPYLGYLDGTNRIKIKPDVVHVLNGKPFAVLDAKYKLESSTARYPNADVYQMLGYCVALQVQKGYLVYAQGSTKPQTRRVRHSSIDIVQYPLDLAAKPQSLLDQIGEIVREACTPSSAT